MSIVRGYDLLGPLDVELFLASAAAVTARHQGLRARLAFTGDGEPALRVLPPTEPCPLTCQAVACDSREQFAAYARAMARQDLQARWDPVASPLYQLRLLRRTAEDHILLATFDHFGFDERAVEIFVRDLWAAYENGGALPGPAGPELAEYLKRQRARYGRRAATVNAAYWARLTAGVPPALQIAAHPHGLGPRLAQRHWFFRDLDPAATAGLRAACRDAPCSPFEACTAVLGRLAFTLTGQDRLAVYVPTDSRERHENDVIGNFAAIRMLALDRPEQGGTPAMLAQVRGQALRAMAYRHLSGGTEAELAAGQLRRWGLTTQRQLLVNYFRSVDRGRGWAASEFALAGLRVTPVRYAPMTVAFHPSLALYVYDSGDALRAGFYYNCDVLPDAAARRLWDEFEAELARLPDLLAAAAPSAGPTGEAPGTPADLAAPELPAGLTPLRAPDGAVCLHADLAQVRAALLSHPAVTDARVRVVPGPEGGTQVSAAIRADSVLPGQDELSGLDGLSGLNELPGLDELREACLSWPQATQYTVPPAAIEPLVPTANGAAS
ncbi:MAG TPA: condensation domain-containing protein [Streptosporangiaceae bacterium]|jgi:hypothetical protein